ncbi:MAG: 50S ribosomal protein L11 methyltransferase [Rhodobacteraceae bacterium]|nr:50S ribosomal protein L11 methyltransferase [Paracoccaceae bacterium]
MTSDIETRPAPGPGGPKMWAARVTVTDDLCAMFEPALEDGAVSVSSYEVEEWAKPRPIWRVEALFTAPPEPGPLAARIAVAAAAARVAEPQLEIVVVEHRDWLAESYAGFQPLRAGQYYVYGDHIRIAPPSGMIPLRLNAATAFGSGEHESTFGCLLALTAIGRDGRFKAKVARGSHAALDLGCGSGILALAISKTWKQPVVASDIDPEAVRIATYNARHNGEAARIRPVLCDGTHAPAIRRSGPYALITANILARPLCRLSARVAALLAPGGRLIMAGLLVWQEAMVLAAYRRQGLVLARRIRIGFWSTLILARPTRN